jgi:excisionase family DNA binding protein
MVAAGIASESPVHEVRRICISPRMATFRIKEAASLLGVSTDTLRRWADAGRIDTTADGLGLEPGMLAVAAVKATNVSVEIPRPAKPSGEGWPGRAQGGSSCCARSLR